MKRFFTYAIAVLVLAFSCISCAKKVSSATYTDAKRFLEAWMHVNYPGVEANEDGIYIINDTPGSGTEVIDSDYVFISMRVYDIPGRSLIEYSDEEAAKQLGTYVESHFYGDQIKYIAEESLSVGVENAIKDMRIGGSRTVVIPRWMNTSTRRDSIEEYLAASDGGTADYIYEITINDAVDSLLAWQMNSLDKFIAKYRPKAECTYNVRGFKYYQVQEPTDTTSFPSDTTVYINYIGRLPNGQVFDTTIADTAKVYNIYSATKTYEPSKVTWGEESTDIQLGGSTVITGFSSTLWQMRPYEKGIGVFSSDFGYGSSGSGSTIPAYYPLIFEIEIVDKPED